MDRSHHDAPQETSNHAIDTLARSLQARLPRRRAASLLAAAVATSLFGFAGRSQPAEARRKRVKNKKRVLRSSGAETRRGTSIPPNCIYVCCDGTCDSWKMCMKCVKWPKPTTTAMLAS